MAFNPGPTEPTPKTMFSVAGDYYKAAKLLTENMTEANNLGPQGPIYYLISHAFELFTKAFLMSKGLKYDDLKKIGHNPFVMLSKCKDLGMDVSARDELMAEVVSNLNKHDMQRYPVFGLFLIGPTGFSEPNNLLDYLVGYQEKIKQYIASNDHVKNSEQKKAS